MPPYKPHRVHMNSSESRIEGKGKQNPNPIAWGLLFGFSPLASPSPKLFRLLLTQSPGTSVDDGANLYLNPWCPCRIPRCLAFNHQAFNHEGGSDDPTYTQLPPWALLFKAPPPTPPRLVLHVGVWSALLVGALSASSCLSCHRVTGFMVCQMFFLFRVFGLRIY